MNLFYQPSINENSKICTLSPEESQHVVKVFRLKKNDSIFLTNGKGLLFKGIIKYPKPDKCEVEILEYFFHKPNDLKIKMAFVPTKKSDKTKLIIEKLTEIGVSEFSLIISQNSERTKVNLEKLEKILISAIKQSKNYHKPKINQIISFADFIMQNKDFKGEKMIANTRSSIECTIKNVYKNSKNIILLVGPEGGFTNEEIMQANNSGFQNICLSNNILRTETAVLFSCFSIFALHH